LLSAKQESKSQPGKEVIERVAWNIAARDVSMMLGRTTDPTAAAEASAAEASHLLQRTWAGARPSITRLRKQPVEAIKA